MSQKLCSRPVVLLIDDQPMVAEAIRRLVGQEIQLEFCSDPRGAVERARSLCPSLILVDLVMPEIDGNTLVRLLRAQPDLSGCPLVVLSSREAAADKASAFEAGADDYLVKLPDRVELLARIRYHCQARRVRNEENEVSLAMARLDEAGNFLEVSPRLAELIGCSVAEMVGSSHLSWLHPDDREHDQGCLMALRNGEIPALTLDQRWLHRDGHWVWMEVTVNPATEKARWIAIYSDISARIETERQLRRQVDQRSRALLSARIATWSWNRRGEICWDAYLPTLLGLDGAQTWSATRLAERVHPDDLERLREEFLGAASSLTALDSEYRVIWPDGSHKEIAVRAEPSEDGLSGVAWDVTERRRVRLRLSARQAVSSQLAEASNLEEAGPRVLETVARTLEWDGAALWSKQGTGGRLQRRGVWPLHEPALPDDFLSSEIGTGGGWNCHQPEAPPRARRMFEAGWQSYLAMPVMVNGEVCGVLEMFDRARKPGNEDEDRLLLTEVVGVIAQYWERKSLEQQFLQSQKMEAVGRLAGGIAHDFNNLLTAITGFASLALCDPESGPLANELHEILRASQRAASLTGQLLAFSRKQMLQPQVVCPRSLLTGLGNMLQRILGEDVLLVVQAEPEVAPVRVDPNQLEQVLLNLVVNARDAMPGGGTLTMTVANQLVQRRQEPELEPGRYVCLTVQDTGCGMAPDIQAHVFEPFFTTKGSRGTGLGLATVYGIVRQSGGHIRLSSQVGRGTTFTLWFPQAETAPDPGAPAASGGEKRGGLEATILVVEDDDGLRNLASRVLRREGYNVLQAANGSEALERSSGRSIDLLLSDMVMPGMSGHEVARRMSVSHPETRVLFMSGYSEEICREETSVDLLPKPFTPDGLLTRVRQALTR